MSAIDYKGIRDLTETILNEAVGNDGDLEGCRVYVEEEPQIGLNDTRAAIAVFLGDRTAAGVEQRIAAGLRQRYHLQLEIWVLAFDLESYRAACDKRDAVLGALELLLMEQRSRFSDEALADFVQLDGGVIFSARNADNTVFTAVAELVTTLQVTAIV